MSDQRPPDESALKRQFAAALIRYGDAHKAGRDAFPGDFIRAFQAAEGWPRDPEVECFLAELRAGVKDECQLLPDRVEVARRAWNIATNEETDRKTQVAALKLYSEVQGFLKAPTVAAKPVAKVMAYKDHGSDEEWEAKTAAQQAALTGSA